jgi:membrane protease subunit (stomatin/prohibitin family)
MLGKLTFAAGFGAGYVLGARAGRQRYESIMSSLRGMRENPQVQQAATTVQEQASDAAAKAAEAAKTKVAEARGSDDYPPAPAGDAATVTPLSEGALVDGGTGVGAQNRTSI